MKLFAAIMFAMLMLAYEPPMPAGAVMVQETVTVAQGDTLWGIAERYCAKSSVRRDPREFVQGIIEENYELFRGRQLAEIHPGDQLKINFWRAD